MTIQLFPHVHVRNGSYNRSGSAERMGKQAGSAVEIPLAFCQWSLAALAATASLDVTGDVDNQRQPILLLLYSFQGYAKQPTRLPDRPTGSAGLLAGVMRAQRESDLC